MMKKRTLGWLTGLVLAIGLTGAAIAQQPPGGGGGTKLCIKCKSLTTCGTTLGGGGVSCEFNRFGRCYTWGECFIGAY